MRAELTIPALDLGVVTADAERALAFYRDTLGLVPDGELPFPGLGVLHRLRCGHSTVKLLALERPPEARAARGGFSAATGFRYCSLHVANLDAVGVAPASIGNLLSAIGMAAYLHRWPHDSIEEREAYRRGHED